MAVWKKIIVSGSSAHLANLDVDSLSSGVVTGADGNLTTTPINGTGNIVATTNATNLVHSGSFSGSFEGDGSNLTGLVTDLRLSGSTGNDTVSLLTDTLTFEGGTNISATVTDNLVTYNLDASFISASSIGTTTTQGEVVQIVNGVSGSAVIIRDLGTTDSPEFAGLTVTGDATVDGDLTVNGTLTTLNTTNTEIKDKFILLNSGSSNPDEGGLIIDEGSGTGHALIYEADAGIQRWGFNASVASNATTANATAYAAAVVDLNNGNHSDSAEYQKRGNIKVDATDDIWIYT